MIIKQASVIFLLAAILLAFPAAVNPLPGRVDARDTKTRNQPMVPFADLADSFLKYHGIRETEEGEGALTPVLEKGYLVVQLGVVDVWHPRQALRDAGDTKVFKSVAGALLEMQENWIELAAGEEAKKACLKDLKALQKWIRTWKHTRLGRKNDSDSGRPDLLEALDAKQPVLEASKRFADVMMSMHSEDNTESARKPLLLILSPTREDFLGLGSFIGSLSEDNKKMLWHDGLAMWTSFNRGALHVIAMEHPANYPGNGDITQGLDMNSREKTGLLQHVVQHACELMLKMYYRDAYPQELISGFATNMVIDMYKENNVRAGGGSKGNRIAKQSKFVPGGRSSGGVLPAKNADTRWRISKGKDHFLEILRLAQRSGARESLKSDGKGRDKRAYFALEPDGGGPARCVRAPFLIISEGSAPVPENYLNDYMEFFRAYRSGFTYWLRNKAKSAMEKAPSTALLQRLLDTSDSLQDGTSKSYFEKKVLEIYGMPLSGTDGSTESLEWQYLEWLSGKKS